MTEIDLIEIDLESLGNNHKSVVWAFGYIIAAQRDVGMTLAHIVDIQESSYYENAASTLREANRSLISVEKTLRGKVERIAIDCGADTEEIVRFFDKDGKTVAAIKIKEVCDE